MLVLLVILLFVLSFFVSEKYELMGDYGTRRTLSVKEGDAPLIEFPIKKAWDNDGMVSKGLEELPSLGGTPLDQTQPSAEEVLYQSDSQLQRLPNHQVDFS